MKKMILLLIVLLIACVAPAFACPGCEGVSKGNTLHPPVLVEASFEAPSALPSPQSEAKLTGSALDQKQDKLTEAPASRLVVIVIRQSDYGLAG